MQQCMPILQLGDCLLVTIQVDLQDQTALDLQDDLAAKIAHSSAGGVRIDMADRVGGASRCVRSRPAHRARPSRVPSRCRGGG